MCVYPSFSLFFRILMLTVQHSSSLIPRFRFSNNPQDRQNTVIFLTVLPVSAEIAPTWIEQATFSPLMTVWSLPT